MSRMLLTLALLMPVGGAWAASAVNSDAEARTITVTEGADQRRVTIEPGASVDFCHRGCFVTMPNGDRVVLAGEETLTLLNGGGRLQ